MIESDLSAYHRYFTKWCEKLYKIEYICMLSPNKIQYNLIKKIFSKSKIHISTVSDWNLNNSNDAKYDLIIACNVFHYSPNPDLWFNNVLNSCRYFWIQDLIDRYRAGDHQLQSKDPVGDSMRYSYLPNYKSEYSESFDLSLYRPYILSFVAYKATPPIEYPSSTCLHFICFMKGFQEANNNPKFSTSMVLCQILCKTKWYLKGLKRAGSPLN